MEANKSAQKVNIEIFQFSFAVFTFIVIGMVVRPRMFYMRSPSLHFKMYHLSFC